MEKIKVGISSCLIGNKVRYDGGHKHDRFITDTLGKYFEYVAVCPEVEYGLPVPREAMRLTGSPENPRIVTIKTNIDHTEGMLKWAEKRLHELEKENLCGFIFKSKSPSSGLQGVKIYSEKGVPVKRGVGIFAMAFIKRFPLIPVEDDGRLNNPEIRENFIERIFVYKRWCDFLKKNVDARGLIDFHTDHKYLIMAHSPKHLTELGRIVSDMKHFKGDTRIRESYIKILMEGLKLMATKKKNRNCLLHIMGYFKKDLTGDEKKELLEIIENYSKGLIPLIVPVVLINHYVKKYKKDYLKRQVYLNPHPMELMLRNHV
ncbi:MAG: DUF523 and DUF1722 domain-containing protein [Syntrophorhabdaceae bacterium]|nr:DUF523 and DUF1722 domain-containing protein [Syntrophorhabdaceae bacterium]